MEATAIITISIRHIHPRVAVATDQGNVKVVSLVTLGMTSHQPISLRDLSIRRVITGNISGMAGSPVTEVAPPHQAVMEAHLTLGRNMALQEVRI